MVVAVRARVVPWPHVHDMVFEWPVLDAATAGTAGKAKSGVVAGRRVSLR